MNKWRIIPNHGVTQAAIEWDVTKNEQTIQKHGIGFIDASELLEIEARFTYLSDYSGKEARFVTVGRLKNKFFAVVYTLRNGNIRLITARRAHSNEEKTYREIHGG
ncbi:MAG: BrnT family toxin [Alphaproteobacteria bacterium]|nr:BrnT family toxin [Alphaproteobacteria bacterium]